MNVSDKLGNCHTIKAILITLLIQRVAQTPPRLRPNLFNFFLGNQYLTETPPTLRINPYHLYLELHPNPDQQRAPHEGFSDKSDFLKSLDKSSSA